MIYPFKEKYLLTQGFGENPQDYARFGLAGHNGLDYGLPCGTKIISPIEGEIREIGNDPGGYGLYIKIENSAEGCLMAHLSQQDVTVGQKVDQEQHLGWSGTTGNSTGCHLHLGYYKFPRNRQNGYAGYIDPLPYLTESAIVVPANMTDEQQRVFKFIEENKGQETNLESVVRSWYGAFITPPKPPEAPISADYTISDLLIMLVKKIFK